MDHIFITREQAKIIARAVLQIGVVVARNVSRNEEKVIGESLRQILAVLPELRSETPDHDNTVAQAMVVGVPLRPKDVCAVRERARVDLQTARRLLIRAGGDVEAAIEIGTRAMLVMDRR